MKGKSSIRVFLEKCKVHLRCGVYEEERKLGVEVEINLEVESGKFVDYEKLYRMIIELSEEEFVYLEDFADRLIEKICGQFEPDVINIKIAKRSLPFHNSMESAGVKIKWERAYGKQV
ncbi:dihydroneopterin aldolase [Desulfurobacterium sp.]